jgi:hypothetical protein
MEFSVWVHEARRAVNDSLTLRFRNADAKRFRPFHHGPITKSCRNAASPRTLYRHEPTRNEANMPFLFWMPMIVMCGLWRATEQDAQTLFPPHR